MSRLFYHTCQDNAGNLLFDVSGTMRLAGTGTLATIYGDEALTIPIANPMTNHPSYGSFKCFLGVGDYDFYMAKSGYTFETLTGVQGFGTMAQQNANAVAITDGQISLGGHAPTGVLDVQSSIVASDAENQYIGVRVWPMVPSGATNAIGLVVAAATGAGVVSSAFRGLQVTNPPTMGGLLTAGTQLDVSAGTNRYNVYASGTADNHFAGHIGLRRLPSATTALYIDFNKSGIHGIVLKHADSDTGPNNALLFLNLAGTAVGSITTTGAATAYNTSSDARLKTAVQTLVGELAVIRALRPVRFRWLADDSEGVGFLAQEVAEHVQGVVTGEPDAVDAEGQILPQQIDMSKLVPWLVGALQTLAGQVETLMERVQALEAGA